MGLRQLLERYSPRLAALLTVTAGYATFRSTTGFLSTIVIANVGHTLEQIRQPPHTFGSTVARNATSFIAFTSFRTTQGRIRRQCQKQAAIRPLWFYIVELRS